MSRDILIDNIHPNRNQPRTQFDPAGLEELARSMGDHGLLSPIMVRPQGDAFEIVHGERRTRAARLLGWATIAANVVEMSDEQAQWAALVENVQRDDLSPLEEAAAYRAMIDAGYTQAQIGEKIAKTQSYVAAKLRLLAMPEPLKPWLRVLTEGHMKQVLRLRKFYAGIPDRKIDCDGFLFIDDEKADTEELIERAGDGGNDELRARIALTYNAIRPWDSVSCFFVPEGPNLTCAVESFLGLAAEAEGGSVPAWVVPAVWFAALAGCAKMSVSVLAGNVDCFMDLMYSHVWVGNLSETKIENFARKSDLRHAGLLYPLPDIMHEAAEGYIEEKNWSCAMPSTMQPWHTGEKMLKPAKSENNRSENPHAGAGATKNPLWKIFHKGFPRKKNVRKLPVSVAGGFRPR